MILQVTINSVYSCHKQSLSIKIAQKPYVIGSLGPKALEYESFEGKGMVLPITQKKTLTITCLDSPAESFSPLDILIYGG